MLFVEGLGLFISLIYVCMCFFACCEVCYESCDSCDDSSK
jgi:hypothetical protein